MRHVSLFAFFLVVAGCSSSSSTPNGPAAGGDPSEEPSDDAPPADAPPADAPPGKDDISVTGTFEKVTLDQAIWNITDVAVVGPKQVYAVGSGNGKAQVFEYDGAKWTDAIDDYIETGITNVGATPWMFGEGLESKQSGGWADYWSAVDQTFVNDVWGSSSKDVYAVGTRGAYRFDGGIWRKLTDPKLSSYAFDAVWGSAADDVWISQHTSGSHGQLFHFDGKTWTDAYATLPKVLRDGYSAFFEIAGSSSDNVFGLSGANKTTLVHYDGKAWTEVREPEGGFECTPTTVWTSGKKNTWLAGTNGCIFHYDGATWTKVESGTKSRLYHLAGSSAEEVWLVTDGKDLLHLVPKK